MKIYQLKIFITLLFLVISSNIFAEHPYPVVTENGKEFYIYTVQKSEGFYSISNRFNIKKREIVKYNPDATCLKLGQRLKIPVQPEEPKRKKLKYNKPTDNIQLKEHIIKPKETLYGLSKQYNVSIDDILDINPWAKNLSIGAVLQIPDSTNYLMATKLQPAIIAENNDTVSASVIATNVNNQNLVVDTINIQNKIVNLNDSFYTSINASAQSQGFNRSKKSHIKIAIIMPFMLEEKKSEQLDIESDQKGSKSTYFTEFYKSCLLALDSLAKTGLNCDVYTYDTGNTLSQLYSVLSKPELSSVDLIIGPAHPSQVPYIEQYANNYNIKTVIPFASNINAINNNKNLYRVISPQNDLSARMIHSTLNNFSDKYFVFLEPSSIAFYNKWQFADSLKSQLNKNSIQYSIVKENDADTITIANKVDSIANLNFDKEILFIVPTTNQVALNKYGEQIAEIKSYNVAVLGFQEWHKYEINELYHRDLYTFANYYTNYSDINVVDFFTKYKNKYGIPSNQQSPNYALLGYDITIFFANLIYNYGSNFENQISSIYEKQLQMKFRFEKLNANSGYTNTGLYLIKTSKNGVEIIE